MIEELIRQISSLQRQVDGLIKPEVGRWVDWTPTVDQGGAVAATVNNARYCVKDNTVHLLVKLTTTAAGTGGSVIQVSGIPTAVQPAFAADTTVIGTAIILDSGTAIYQGAVSAQAANTLQFGSNGNTNWIGATPNFALANGDIISFQATYERA